jgi:hypothetical protein
VVILDHRVKKIFKGRQTVRVRMANPWVKPSCSDIQIMPAII